MARITADVNDEWLEAARTVLGTDSKVATINEALRAQACKETTREVLAALDSVQMDFGASNAAFGYGGGRDLSALESDANDCLT